MPRHRSLDFQPMACAVLARRYAEREKAPVRQDAEIPVTRT
jgi:hypothetical protein